MALSRRVRILWTVLIAWHLLAMVGSMARKTPVGAAIRVVTKPYEQLLGVHQTWTMFSPNAPAATIAVEAVGITVDGAEVPLPTSTGDLAPAGVSIVYDRLGKLERNVTDKRKGSLRSGYARGMCRAARKDGLDLSGVVFIKHEVATPPPGQRAAAPRSQWPVDTHTYRVRSCAP